jgi:hypothetical protein
MRPSFLYILLTGLLWSLASCGEIRTIVSVYPDGSAQLRYEIESSELPSGEVLKDVLEGKFSSLLTKTANRIDFDSLAEDLSRTRITPYLRSLEQEGKISGYRIFDTARSMGKRTTVQVSFDHYQQVGPFHSQFKKDISVLDSIFQLFTRGKGGRLNDSIAIVSLGDSLELQIYQLYDFGTEEIKPERARLRSRVLFDSIRAAGRVLGVDDAGQDSIFADREDLTEAELDSLGIALTTIEEVGYTISRPSIELRAAVLLSNNVDELPSGTVEHRVWENGIAYSASTREEPAKYRNTVVRQRFRHKLSSFSANNASDRAQWRQVLDWCDECERSFKDSKPTPKRNAAGVEFKAMADSSTLVIIDCGLIRSEQVSRLMHIDTLSKVPTIRRISLDQTIPINDLAAEFESGAETVGRRSSDFVTGKLSFDADGRGLSVTSLSIADSFKYAHDGFFRWTACRLKNRRGATVTIRSQLNRRYMYTVSCDSPIRAARASSLRVPPPPPPRKPFSE